MMEERSFCLDIDQWGEDLYISDITEDILKQQLEKQCKVDGIELEKYDEEEYIYDDDWLHVKEIKYHTSYSIWLSNKVNGQPYFNILNVWGYKCDDNSTYIYKYYEDLFLNQININN
jgi:hypothetical protein